MQIKMIIQPMCKWILISNSRLSKEFSKMWTNKGQQMTSAALWPITFHE